MDRVRSTHRMFALTIAVVFAATLAAGNRGLAAEPLGTALTYQGQLKKDGAPVSGQCNLFFSLWDDAEDGGQIGDTQFFGLVDIDHGLLTMVLNENGEFGPDAFNGDRGWLEVSVQCVGDDTETTLPRQELTPTPYAHFAKAAPWDGLIGVPAQLPESCANGEVAKWIDDTQLWGCAADETGRDGPWIQEEDDIFYTAGRVGIGTTSFVPGGDTVFTMSAVLPSGRHGLACAASAATGSPKIYCFGGTAGSTQVVEYDPANPDQDPVTMNAVLDPGRQGLACAADPDTGKIYCFGGINEGAPLRQIIEYDPATDMLNDELTAELPWETYSLACAASAATGSPKIYCFGGVERPFHDEILEYDPATGILNEDLNAVLPSGRAGLSCVTDPATGKIYCFGGIGSGYLNEIVEYDPATGILNEDLNAVLPSGRQGLSCAAHSDTGKIYCFDGEPATNLFVHEIVEYDPQGDKINVMSGLLPSARAQLACTADPDTGNIYCFGGRDSGGSLDEIVEYDPLFQLLLQVGEPGNGTGAMANTWSVFSSRAFKRDISPLGRMDYQNILSKLNVTDVVRYRYADDARRTRHLGVIAEDSPVEILSPGGKAVSLGDYTAFLMAAIKAQQDQIEQLSIRVGKFEATLAESTSPESGGVK